MAALTEARAHEIVDLRDLSADDLQPLLEEEVLAWRTTLDWDFTASADLVRRFVRIQALHGYALMAAGRCIGYSYYVSEDRKALIGDLYMARDWAAADLEDALLGAVLNALFSLPAVHRIETQLMMLHGPFERALPYLRYLRIHPRLLMVADLAHAPGLREGSAAQRCAFNLWDESRQSEAAQLISAAYRGHVDSTINDQYRSPEGARRFLSNVVQYPGCGVFNEAGSWTADTLQTRRLCGLSLASKVAAEVGHITQICVAPEVKGKGIGYELLRRSLTALEAEGCEKASLTVTASNQEAVQLYQRVGFRATRRFAAYVWDGF